MKAVFDSVKNARNIVDRGLSFERATDFVFETALFSVDNRHDHGETRWRALGLLDGRLHALVFVEIEDGIRVISLRKANRREVGHYEQATRFRTNRG